MVPSLRYNIQVQQAVFLLPWQCCRISHVSDSVELQRQFLALRRAGALPLQAWLERRGLGSCALPTHRELPFVYNWGVLRTPLFYQIKSLCNCTSAAPEPLVPQSNVPQAATLLPQYLLWAKCPVIIYIVPVCDSWRTLSPARGCDPTIRCVPRAPTALLGLNMIS